ncbi:Na+:H+ dicarboxylate symporter [Vibrio azureus]|uniref:Putative proton/glutamate symporter n=1 Tax=Vibrio azureus NBRC 104587 TaxID=1219077 RepID=U3ATH7_9VIBR|nr:dicarboxylate/amino acid:cation symporter [Vibrio azureus]AUI88467.1 Na+:H+ dicarboxylate symporter [Vibrio azureus]GAD77065.1 putative proton/glutamate symporter [Vibrio azureus NBRC 104587]
MRKFQLSLPIQLLISALLAWVAAQLTLYFFDGSVDKAMLADNGYYQTLMLGKTAYLGLLKMVVGLMVLFSLVEGITNIGSVLRLKALGGRTVLFYSFTTLIAIALGLGASLALPAWEPLSQTVPVASDVRLIDAEAAGGAAILTNLVKMALVNPFAAIANGNLLAIVVFSFMAGVAILLSVPAGHPLLDVVSGLNRSVNTIIRGIVKLSPIAIFAIVLDITLTSDGNLIQQLALFALLVFTLTMIHGLIVLPTLARTLAGISPIKLFKAISAPLAMAFATSSSAATLPLAKQTAEENLDVSPEVSSMVLPLGSVMNMDGTALFEGVAAIFLAQLFGIDLSTTGLVMIFIMAMVSSVGAPGMPSGSMSGMQLVLLAAGIPLEAIAILLVIERPLDTFRTAVNVEGDLVATLVIDRWQKKHALTNASSSSSDLTA